MEQQHSLNNQCFTCKGSIGFDKYARMNENTANNNSGFYYLIEANDFNTLSWKEVLLFLFMQEEQTGGNFTFNHYWYDGANSNADNGVYNQLYTN